MGYRKQRGSRVGGLVVEMIARGWNRQGDVIAFGWRSEKMRGRLRSLGGSGRLVARQNSAI